MFRKTPELFKKTPRSITVEEKCGGQYKYFGLEFGIRNVIEDNQNFISQNLNSINLKINIDGVPLFKSSSMQFWPILCSFEYFKPFLVSIFYGNSKPSSVSEFLEDFLEEYSQLKTNGLQIEDARLNIKVRIKAFICDAPARALITGYYACERCTIKGYWKNNRIILYSKDECSLRTDEEFSLVVYDNHQTSVSPLIEHGIQCVKAFCLDYMHLTCLGVVKRIIYFLKHGPAVCRLSYQQMCDISKKLQFLSGKLPSEFARQPRSMFEVERWKATEFRQFLLYTGPVVLKDIISDTMYEHFLSLSVAMSILLTSDQDKRMAYLEYAQQLLNFFVDKSIEIYTATVLVYNVHCLKHLPEDVRNFNCSLNDISSFPYENHLQTIKRLVRNARSPVVQVCKRLTEIEMAGNRKLPIKTANGIFVSPKKKLVSSDGGRKLWICFREDRRFFPHLYCDTTIKN